MTAVVPLPPEPPQVMARDEEQLHRSAAGGAEHNSPEQFPANISETDHGYHLRMSVRDTGSFTMTNERTGFTKEYPAR